MKIVNMDSLMLTKNKFYTILDISLPGKDHRKLNNSDKSPYISLHNLMDIKCN